MFRRNLILRSSLRGRQHAGPQGGGAKQSAGGLPEGGAGWTKVIQRDARLVMPSSAKRGSRRPRGHFGGTGNVRRNDKLTTPGDPAQAMHMGRRAASRRHRSTQSIRGSFTLHQHFQMHYGIDYTKQ